MTEKTMILVNDTEKEDALTDGRKTHSYLNVYMRLDLHECYNLLERN